MRPINSSINSPNYQVSKYLANVLKHLRSNQYSVNNSSEFKKFIQSQTVQPDEEIVSFDVISLFTSIPVKLALQVVDSKLRSDDKWQDNTNLTHGQLMSLLKFVLNNSYFVFEETHYHQIFGCAMGSPVSAVIAELVMEHIETIALQTSPVKPRWWRRYVDDANACIKTDKLEAFHSHLNSIDPDIQFTVERPSTNSGKSSIPFLDTCLTVPRNSHSKPEIKVYRKPTHTDKYLPFDSHHPAKHKRSVVTTLMRRAEAIPTKPALCAAEKSHVREVLKLNGYNDNFIDRACKTKDKSPDSQKEEHSEKKGFVVLPYIQGVSERIKRSLNAHNIQTTCKPHQTLASIFRKPKDRPPKDRIPGIVYKLKCKDCSFTYVGESKRSWRSRSAEHNPARAASRESAIRHHAITTTHDIHPRDAKILETNEHNFARRLFLESFYSTIDNNTVNERRDFPRAYLPLIKNFKEH